MSKKLSWSLVIGLAVLTTFVFASSFPNSTAQAQKALTGDWTATLGKEGSARLNLNFERHDERGRRNQMNETFDFSDLQGLSREQVNSGGAVRFSLVREAGTIECEGSFQNGKGSGTFRFTGNQNFVSAMKSRGFDFDEDFTRNSGHEPEDRLFAAATLNVTTALADDLSSAGFGKLHVDDLFKAAIFKVDSKFMREMKASGFPDLGMEDLVKARIFKIDAQFASEVAQMGFAKEPFENLVKMRIFKITPQSITEARNEGLTDLSIEDLVKMHIFKIDTDFIRQAKAEGVPLEVERLVERRLRVGRIR
ncbi:MAG: hypothetical protein M3R68_08730 [Acidobacteriota bacterium]|nr:hypothetical protein [Acidobacteriota bacterium]